MEENEKILLSEIPFDNCLEMLMKVGSDEAPLSLGGIHEIIQTLGLQMSGEFFFLVHVTDHRSLLAFSSSAIIVSPREIEQEHLADEIASSNLSNMLLLSLPGASRERIETIMSMIAEVSRQRIILIAPNEIEVSYISK